MRDHSTASVWHLNHSEFWVVTQSATCQWIRSKPLAGHSACTETKSTLRGKPWHTDYCYYYTLDWNEMPAQNICFSKLFHKGLYSEFALLPSDVLAWGNSGRPWNKVQSCREVQAKWINKASMIVHSGKLSLDVPPHEVEVQAVEDFKVSMTVLMSSMNQPSTEYYSRPLRHLNEKNL